MKVEEAVVAGIPAIVWGEHGERVLVAVHGNRSNKKDIVIRMLAETAVERGWQVLSFDLPKHGDRKNLEIPCKVQRCCVDLRAIIDYAKERWIRIGLFACSMGAYFSLLTCSEDRLEPCLFLSPVVDMRRLTEKRLEQFQISRERLKAEGEIELPGGVRLYEEDYGFIQEHPIRLWNSRTAILYGERDQLCEWETLQSFVDRFPCELDVVENGEHFFYTPEQLRVYGDWLGTRIVS